MSRPENVTFSQPMPAQFASLRPSWPKDNTAALIAFYGDPRGTNGRPNPAFVRGLSNVQVPFKMVCSWDMTARVKSIQCNTKCSVALASVLDRIWLASGRKQAIIEQWGAHLFGGTFNYRPKRGLASLSVHAFGAAIDLDPERNGLGVKVGHMPAEVVAAFKAEGAIWGGDFKSRSDPMHFQFATV